MPLPNGIGIFSFYSFQEGDSKLTDAGRAAGR